MATFKCTESSYLELLPKALLGHLEERDPLRLKVYASLSTDPTDAMDRVRFWQRTGMCLSPEQLAIDKRLAGCE